MQEEWRDIPGCEGRYQVSNLGQVKSLNHRARKGVEKILIPHILPGGYHHVRIHGNDGSRKMIGVHRLVMLAFVGQSSLHVNHKDWNPRNNRLDNLEYCTPAENNRHARLRPKDPTKIRKKRTGWSRQLSPKNGKLVRFAKLVDDQVREIKKLLAKGTPKKEIAPMFNVSVRCIHAIDKGENWSWVKYP